MSFKVRIKKHNDLDVIELDGDVSGRDVGKIHEKLESIWNPAATRLGVDLSNVVFIDSHGLGMLIYIWKTLEGRGCELVFIAPGPFVKEMLASTNLQNLIRIVDSADRV